MRTVMSFLGGSSGAFNGLSPQHLKDMAGPKKNDAELLRKSLAALMDLMTGGNVPLTITSLIYGAKLLALRKKDGVIRPISAGFTLRRLCCKIIGFRVQDALGRKLRPIQLGQRTRGGAKTSVHATCKLLDLDKDSKKVLLKIDFKNAFNLVHRQRVMEAVNDVMPEYAPFFASCYGKS